MHQSASEQIVDHIAQFEGYIPHMYLDIRGLVTVGIGNLLDPYTTYGKKVRFTHADGTPASSGEVKAEFDLFKSKAVPGGGAPQAGYASAGAFASITRLRARAEDTLGAVKAAVKANENKAIEYFGRDYDGFPADVQVVLVQMGYGGGLRYRRDDLTPFLRKHDFIGARRYTYLTSTSSGRGSYKRYNAAFNMMMMNGAILEQCAKLSMTHWNPRDPTIFYGIKRGLQLSRWLSSNDMSLEVRKTDVVTEGNYAKWVLSQ